MDSSRLASAAWSVHEKNREDAKTQRMKSETLGRGVEGVFTGDS
jgi:hypothetical protein